MAVSRPNAADTLQPLISALLDPEAHVDLEFWDGSAIRGHAPKGVIRVRSPRALQHVMWAPRELGMARAYVLGDLDFAGDIIDLMAELRTSSPQQRRPLSKLPAVLAAVHTLGLYGGPPAPPDIEFQPHRLRAHSLFRDAAAISHHYDVSNDFYAMVLGESMVYSCAYFPDRQTDLTAAQRAKCELICQKLQVGPGMRLLDVGCGWGTMAMRAAAEHGADVVGITISKEQAQRAAERVAAAGLDDRVEIRLQDYRELSGETFDVISSIGMSEHVGSQNLTRYFRILRAALRPQGRLLNHAISSIGGSRLGKSTFMYRYVFPDGELIDVARIQAAMQEAGFEIRDVQSLREHYALTLRHWVRNLERNWDAAVSEVGEQRARVWRLYMAGSSVGFSDGGLNLHQVLGVVPDAGGGSGMPLTRPV